MTRQLLTFALTLGLVALPGDVRAQTASPDRLYTVLIFEREDDLARRDKNSIAAASYWEAYNEFAGVLMKAGALRGGSALSERDVFTARGSGGADGGVRGARLGGYFVIEAASSAEALKLAKLAPAFAATVEVRPHRANPSAPMSPAGESLARPASNSPATSASNRP